MGAFGSPQKVWSVGELARSCGVTVRTLHHYDKLGLVVPSTRTSAGHRRYTDEDVQRLYTVLALRRLGLRLGGIVEWLEAGTSVDLLALVRRQLEMVDDELRERQHLRARLVGVIRAVEHSGRPTVDDLIAVMEVMDVYDDHLTAAQLDRLELDRRELGFPGIERWRAKAEGTISALRAAQAAGSDPADRRVQELVGQLRDLRRQFTGRDPAVTEALRGVHDDTAWDDLRALVPQDAELRAFWKQARAAAGG